MIRDLGLHLLRAELRRDGATLSQATAEIARRLGLEVAVIPMSDDRVRTRVATAGGELSFQEWFVRRRCEPPVRGPALRRAGDGRAPSPAAVTAVTEAELVVIGPSNPRLSIDPICALLGPHLERERVIAVSPIVGGRALKGPTVALMAQLGEEPTALGVARHYAGLAAEFVLDRADAGLRDAVNGVGDAAARPRHGDGRRRGRAAARRRSAGSRRRTPVVTRPAGAASGPAVRRGAPRPAAPRRSARKGHPGEGRAARSKPSWRASS